MSQTSAPRASRKAKIALRNARYAATGFSGRRKSPRRASSSRIFWGRRPAKFSLCASQKYDATKEAHGPVQACRPRASLRRQTVLSAER